MSVQCNQYLCYGYMLDFKDARDHLVETLGEDGYTDLSDKYSDNAFNADIVQVHGCSMLEDGMDGKYTFFGKIYAKSNNGCFLQTAEITAPEPGTRANIITEHEFRRLFGEDFDVEARTYLITHYR